MASAGKIPPHIARELRRHVAASGAKKRYPTSNSAASSLPNGAASNNGIGSSNLPIILAGCLALTGTMAIIPYAFVNWIDPLTERDGVLTKSQIRRGAFNNSGSTDAGKDEHWDFRTGTRIKDEDYVKLFERDDLGDDHKD